MIIGGLSMFFITGTYMRLFPYGSFVFLYADFVNQTSGWLDLMQVIGGYHTKL